MTPDLFVGVLAICAIGAVLCVLVYGLLSGFTALAEALLNDDNRPE